MRTFVTVMLIGLAVVLVSASTYAASEKPEQFTVGPIVVEQAWSRATPVGAKVGAGYLTIKNTGSSADRLLSVSSPAAGKIEIHEMATKDGVMTMRPISGGLTIDAGKSVALAPGGYHLMMMDLHGPLKQGGQIQATLVFEKAGSLQIKLKVEGVGASGPAASPMHGMPNHKM